ncbi:MAG: N-acetyl-gamma-glutamyl-phosphate reductase [Candidatus Nanopelagicales bacterium]
MATKIGIVGASGYAGGELLRLLASHPDFEVAVLAAGSQAGQPVASIHPQLPQYANVVFDSVDIAQLNTLDLVFVAIPHGESAALTTQLSDNVKVVDLGADHRLQNSDAWDTYYSSGEMAEPWVYGLPELPGRRRLIAEATRIANPGCYATAIELAYAPLINNDLIELDDLVVVAASGTSGAGRKATANLLATEVMGSMSAYKVGGLHQHTAEIEQELSGQTGEQVTLAMTPLLVPMPRGILATCTATAKPGVTQDAIDLAFQNAYVDEPFVQVLTQTWPTTAAVAGSNNVQLRAVLDPHANRITVISTEDNLVKGAAGQAVQNANIMLGHKETAGLSAIGVAP